MLSKRKQELESELKKYKQALSQSEQKYVTPLTTSCKQGCNMCVN